MVIGVLALQGDFALHQQRVVDLGATALPVRDVATLRGVDALIIPGGESSTLLRLLDQTLRTELVQAISKGLPILATCAGLILLAKSASNPVQESLDLIDVDVKRNAYGRQVDSFVDPTLNWTTKGRAELENNSVPQAKQLGSRTLEGVFIRAPKITRVGKNVTVLIERGMEPVLVKQGSILGATFHPELSQNAVSVHQLLLAC
jgi:pyridoxal 5'-phosphate synthase pdxT subunit